MAVARQPRADATELVVHVERCAQRAVGIVAVRDRRSEEREQRIAGVLLDVPLVANDDARQAGDDGVDHLEQLLGVEPFSEAREARQVGEEGGDEAPLLRRPRGRGHAAVPAETGTRDVLGATRAARPPRHAARL